MGRYHAQGLKLPVGLPEQKQCNRLKILCASLQMQRQLTAEERQRGDSV